ncbi:pilus assembly FimT family protein [Kaarinaea lacus]
MNFRERGLSIVEIVMMLAVLAILATSAIPSFVDKKSSDATQSTIEGIAGSLGSASAINFAVRSISSSNGIAVANCGDVAKALEGSLSSDYTIATTPIKPGTTETCTVTHRNGESAQFVGHGIS